MRLKKEKSRHHKYPKKLILPFHLQEKKSIDVIFIIRILNLGH